MFVSELINFDSVNPQIKNQRIDLLLIDAGKMLYKNREYGEFRHIAGVTLQSLHKGSIVIYCDFMTWDDPMRDRSLDTHKKFFLIKIQCMISLCLLVQ